MHAILCNSDTGAISYVKTKRPVRTVFNKPDSTARLWHNINIYDR